MSSTFDPNSFLNKTYTESMATQYVPVPVGIYPGITQPPQVTTGVKDNKPWFRLELPIVLDSAQLREELGRDEVKMRYSIMLDVDENNNLARGIGRNVQLGRLRDALGLNNENEEFSLNMLAGRPCQVSVEHRAHRTRPGEVVAEVAEIGAMG